jgi:murein DD-endopeptidase MepM/ murein hydrolase activator NlpD
VPYLYERPSRHPKHALLALLAAVVAGAVTLGLPATAPRGEVLDLVSGPAGPGAVTGQEPSSTGPDPTAASSAAPESAPPASPTPSDQPLPAPTAPPVASLTGYQWPIAHPRLTLPFGPTAWGTRLVAGERFHDGVDLATFCGDRIVAAHDGTVLAAGRHYDRVMGWVGDLGPYLRRLDRKHLWFELPIVVVIDDGNGYRSMYAHFERIDVKVGEVVHAGQLLGYEGATGHATGCHLHYGLFSPLETATFRIRPDVVKRMKLPTAEVARVDPLQVLPPKRGINAPKVPKGSDTAETSPAPEPLPGGSSRIRGQATRR